MPSKTDDRIQEILIRWAEAKWVEDLNEGERIVKVELIGEYDPGWSEYSEGAYTEAIVRIQRYDGDTEWIGKRYYHLEETTALVNEILTFALTGAV